jgi:DNA polymerase IV (archaeal DinB-like DNA polymerase)
VPLQEPNPFAAESGLSKLPVRRIAHIDMDSFYASAEVRRNLQLKDGPVVIGADPMGGKGRGVVLTCNYHARKFGVRSAMPISEAWRLCPKAVYLPPDFAYYGELSEQVMGMIRGKVEAFEQVSIDEAFVDLTGVTGTLEEAVEWVGALKTELWLKTGLTCSVGVAENKSAAKIATDLQKPDGVTVIPPGLTRERLAPLPIKVISGVGAKTESVLAGKGIATVGDLQRLGLDVVKRLLGRSGVWLWEVANGVENEEVREHAVKSVSTERTFYEDTGEWEAVERAVEELVVELAGRVKGSCMTFRRVGIKIRFRGFETHTKETRLPAHSNSGVLIKQEALSLLRSFRGRKEPVRLVGVKVSELGRELASQSEITAWMEHVGSHE